MSGCIGLPESAYRSSCRNDRMFDDWQNPEVK